MQPIWIQPPRHALELRMSKICTQYVLDPTSLASTVQVYERYHPYQYLAYWYEMRRTYEDLFGCLTEMNPQDYARCTGDHYQPCIRREVARHCLDRECLPRAHLCYPLGAHNSRHV